MSQVVDDSTWTFSLQVMEVAMPVSNPDANSVVGIGACEINCGASTFTNRKDKPHPAHTFWWLWYVSILPFDFSVTPQPLALPRRVAVMAVPLCIVAA